MAHRKPAFKGKKDFLSYVEVNGTAGRWIAPPGTKRSEDEVVLYYVHGGGMVVDTGGDCQIWAMRLAEEMNIKRNVQFSVFSLDYNLAPDHMYPSQLIEVLAGYHYLVNTLCIPEDKICIAGDSAGGNLVAAFLLHLARPNPVIQVPSSLGPTPRRPGSAFLISPWVALVSSSPTRKANAKYDLIDIDFAAYAALDYIGVEYPMGKSPIWNPLHILSAVAPPLDAHLLPAPGAQATHAGNEGVGVDLLLSPYVNPSVCGDLEWWKEACPDGGRTMVAWGGKEAICEDVEDLVAKLESAGVQPRSLCKPLGVHDWILFEESIPGLWITRETGPSRERNWGMDQLGNFLQDIDIRARKINRDSKRRPEEPVPKKEAVELAPTIVTPAATPSGKAGRRRK
ncbi:hypothetical protein RQP46_003308 [Phenoliferia psychrophenolica]